MRQQPSAHIAQLTLAQFLLLLARPEVLDLPVVIAVEPAADRLGVDVEDWEWETEWTM
jgi:hypothetical protein